MSTHVFGPKQHRELALPLELSSHWVWLAGGFLVAFTVPFVLADQLGLNRDLYYGLYAIAVVGLLLTWARSTRYDLLAAARRHWIWALGLGIAVAGLLALMVVATEDATSRPESAELVAAVLWRGVVYGVVDGLLLSVFPILAVFTAFAGTRLYERFAGKLAAGLVAVLAVIVMTAVYHAGYSEYRSSEIARPLQGSVAWSVPTLVTLNPIGAPIAHAGMHVSAVLHSYETETFLPPHD